jgi:DNA-binding transcriptional ArsR family regulator
VPEILKTGAIVFQFAFELQPPIFVISIVIMNHVEIDDYVLDVLLPDLTGHDRSPAAFLVYVVLWTKLYRSEQRSIGVSLNQLSELAGLSKSAVQGAIRILKRRGLVKITKSTRTAVPQYELVRHWVHRRAKRNLTA